MTPKALIWPSKSPVNSLGRQTIPSPECKGVGKNAWWSFTSDERQWAVYRKLLSTWSTVREEVRISTKTAYQHLGGEGLASPKIMDQVTWIIEHFWDKKIKLAPSFFLSMHFNIDSIRYWHGLYICFFSRGRFKLLRGRGISLIGNPKCSFYISQQCIQNRILFYFILFCG